MSGRHRRRRSPAVTRRGGAFGLAALTAVAAATSVTAATLTDASSVPGNTLAASAIHLTLSSSSALFNLGGMLPGDSQAAPLTVTNTGEQARYSVTATTTENTLAAALQLTVLPPSVPCATANQNDASALYRGPLGSTAGVKVLGDPAQGPDPGDRTLAAGTSETLCLIVSLPLTASNSTSNLATTLTLTFTAEQVANNTGAAPSAAPDPAQTTADTWPAQVAAAPDTVTSTTPSTFLGYLGNSSTQAGWRGVTTDGTNLQIASEKGFATAPLSNPAGYTRPGSATTYWGITRYSGTIYATNAASSNGNISTIDPATGTSVAKMTGLNQPKGLTTDGTYLYLMSASSGTATTGTVKQITVSGTSLGTKGTVWSSMAIGTALIADGEGNLYASDTSGNLIRKTVSGGATTTLTTLPGVPSAFLGATHYLYAAVGSTLYRVGLTDGSTSTIATLPYPIGGLTTDGTYIYATQYDSSGPGSVVAKF